MLVRPASEPPYRPPGTAAGGAGDPAAPGGEGGWRAPAELCCPAPQDDYPLASLPLLGYSVSVPSEDDGIHKEHVFKLQFKSHVYFFRAESKYTFRR